MFPMKLIEDYKILSYKGDPKQLEDAVKEKLAEGWTILGSVQVNHNPNADEGQIYTQCMIKVAEQ